MGADLPPLGQIWLNGTYRDDHGTTCDFAGGSAMIINHQQQQYHHPQRQHQHHLIYITKTINTTILILIVKKLEHLNVEEVPRCRKFARCRCGQQLL